MATISISTELDVLGKYASLMESSLSSESFYARTKDTLNEYFKNNSINNNDRAQVLANTLGSITNSLSSTAMSVALQWSTNEVELALKKLETGKQLDILDEQKNLLKAQVSKATTDNIATQAEVWRMYGKPAIGADGKLISLTDDCKLYWDTKNVEENIVNLGKEGRLLDSRLNESYAAIHKTVADTVVNYGPWTYTLTNTGIQTTPVRGSINGGADFAVLSDVQRVIAKEQAKGYAYNAWSNAVTASAGMVGTIVASDGLNVDVSDLVALATGIMRNLGTAKDAYRSGEVPLPPPKVTTP